MMKNFKLFLLSFALIAGFLTSCSNEDTVVEEQDIEQTEAITESLTQLARQFDAEGDLMPMTNPSGNIVFDFGFDFVYPLNLSFNNGTTVTVNSLDELIDIIINSTEDLYVDGIEFPFDVEVYNEDTNSIEVITINNEDDFFDLLDSFDWDNQDPCECFEDYNPVCVEVEAPDGVNFTITYPNECYALCDGFTPNDFVDNCAEDTNNTGGFECFELNFPITIITDDQQTITVNSQEELDNALYNVYYFDFVYPFGVIYADGTTATVANQESLFDLLEDCFDIVIDDCNECQNEEFNPVCVEVDSPSGGTEILTFPNACFAECEGFDSADFVACDNTNPNWCSEQEVFDYLLECQWYINTSLYDTTDVQYAQFSQDGTVTINNGTTGTWDLSSNPATEEVFAFFTFNDAPYDAIAQLDWSMTLCSEEFIVFESGDQFIQLERGCENNDSGCTPNDIVQLLADCSWSVGNYTYIFNADGSLVITDNTNTIAGFWFIGNTGGSNAPASIMIQGDQNLTDEWFFSGCDVDDVIVTSSANPVVPVVYNCN